MNPVLLIARREFSAYFASLSGYLILAGNLLVSGLLFNVYAVSNRPKFSQKVLEDFFYFSSGIAIVTAVVLAVRLIAEERQSQTLVLLTSAPVSERQIVMGKYFSALAFFALITLASVYLPTLILFNGKITALQIMGGYLGLVLLGSAVLSISMLASSWASSQLMAAAFAGVMVIILLVTWLAARVTEPPLKEILSFLALHNTHFNNFSSGLLNMKDVVYYLSVTVFFLECTVLSLASWRWRE